MKYFLLFLVVFFHSSSFTFLKGRSRLKNGVALGVWTKFDLVRPTLHWGSNGTTSFHRIQRPLDAGGPSNGADVKFGFSIANLGDLDGNGVEDIAVGAIGEAAGTKSNAGGVYIFFMEASGNYSRYTLINGADKANEPQLRSGDQFGYSLATIGDLDNSGITQLLVGAPGTVFSTVYILYLTREAYVLNYRIIRGQYISQQNTTGNHTSHVPPGMGVIYDETYILNGPPISFGSRFGTAVANLGDIHPDYFLGIAVSEISPHGETVYLLFINQFGWVQNYTTLTAAMAGIDYPLSSFGASLKLIPRISIRDPFHKLAVGVSRLYEAGTTNLYSGLVFIFFLTDTGHVNHTKVVSETSNGQVMPLVVRVNSFCFEIFLFLCLTIHFYSFLVW
jgi:hypothetical protein